MVPGQVIEADTIGFMRKLDVKEIHGYNHERGLKLIKLSAIGKERAGGKSAPAPTATPKSKATVKQAR
jgi:arginine decarboxylase